MKRTSEAAFETVIEAHLLAKGYVPVPRDGFDRERAIFPATRSRIHPRDPAEGVGQARNPARRQDRRASAH